MKPFYIVQSKKIYSYDLRFNFLNGKETMLDRK